MQAAVRGILALDQGTTSSRAILFGRDGEVLAIAQREFRQFYPKPGWVEHDPEEIWESQLAVAAEVVNGVPGLEVVAIGITNQRETTIVWDRATGRAIHNAIVWQDRRTAEICDALRAHEELFRERTGLVLDAYFSATKLRWILDHVRHDGDLAFGTVDSWLIWKLTGGRVHVTDATNASRTLLFDIHRAAWDPELCAIFGIDASLLPAICASSGVIATTARGLPIPEGIPIAGIAGDQQAALFGQRCIAPGMAKNTYGTGSFLVMNTGPSAVTSRHGLLSTIAWQLPHAPRSYALEGSIFVTGAAVQWLRDGLGIIRNASDIEALAASVDDSGGVLFVPAFTGLGTPHWDPHARGTITGLTRGTTAAHLARATLESIALQSNDVLEAMREDAGIALTELRVDGGAAANDLLMQLQADLAGIPVVRARTTETTALGAAYLAGLATGFWSADEIDAQWQAERTFLPRIGDAAREEKIAEWRRALLRAKAWARPARA
ncbi:MAG TPA: glycerol kinase GlpK [Thermoanaerobaculia bacterium]|nr:glycerol kinase GlpK [Thermoanaerobaculia bacterium]